MRIGFRSVSEVIIVRTWKPNASDRAMPVSLFLLTDRALRGL